MKSFGGTTPRCGWSHRSSASTPTVVPSKLDTTGWYTSRNWPSSCAFSQLLGGAHARAGPHVGREEHRPLPAVALGLDHRVIGVAHERFGVGGRAVGDGDADARRHPERMAADRERVVERAEQPVRDLRWLRRRDAHEADHDERVAVEAPDGVAGSQHVREPLSGGDEDVVAARVPVGVVDPPEAIEVAEQHCRTRRRRRPLGPEAFAQPLGQSDPVDEPGEGIAARRALQACARRASSRAGAASSSRARRTRRCRTQPPPASPPPAPSMPSAFADHPDVGEGRGHHDA